MCKLYILISLAVQASCTNPGSLTIATPHTETEARFSIECSQLTQLVCVAATCPEGFSLNPEVNRCFRLFHSKRNWTDAREVCRTYYADLVAMDGDFSVKVMLQVSSSFHKDEHYWIGLTDLITDGNFQWLDGSALVQHKWYKGQPNGRTKQNCVVAEAITGVWEDKKCSELYRYICEIPPDLFPNQISMSAMLLTDENRIRQQHVLDRKSAMSIIDCAGYCLHRRVCDIFTFATKTDKAENCFLGFYGPVTSKFLQGIELVSYAIDRSIWMSPGIDV